MTLQDADVCARVAKHAALGDAGALVAALQTLSASPHAEVAATLRYHHLATLIVHAVNRASVGDEVDPELLSAIERARAGQPAPAALLDAFDEIQRSFRAAGLGIVLLKGLYFAQRLYGGYERRPQYDLDVLVRASERRAVRRTLERLGYRREAYDLHSDTFTRGDKKVDVHPWLRWTPMYRLDEHAVWQSAKSVRLDPIDVLTLSDEFTLVLLGLSCFEDLGQGMAKLKQLLDLFLFLRQMDASLDWQAFLTARKRERIDTIVAHVFALVMRLFEGEQDLPRLQAALARRQDHVVAPTRELALTLISAPRKHPANLSWFARIYPGSLAHYLAWFWVAGFPHNVAARLRAATASRSS